MVKILLVEDDSNLREIYGARLEAEGYKIVSASDGEEALALAVREQPDLIVSDVMMPKISGFDMLDILRSTPETRNVKVIMMTALSQDEDRQRGEQLGADRYLVKSQVTLDDVVGIAKELLSSNGPATTIINDDSAQASAGSDDQGGQGGVAADNSQTTNDDASSDFETLNKEVEQFVASSPLMNGVAPSPSGTERDAEAATPQPPVNV